MSNIKLLLWFMDLTRILFAPPGGKSARHSEPAPQSAMDFKIAVRIGRLPVRTRRPASSLRQAGEIAYAAGYLPAITALRRRSQKCDPRNAIARAAGVMLEAAIHNF